MEETTPFGPAEATSNDASDDPVHSIIGALPRTIRQRTVEIAFGRNKQDNCWKTKVGPFELLLEPLLTFERGSKDGMAITQGGLVTTGGCPRIAKNVTRGACPEALQQAGKVFRAYAQFCERREAVR